MKYNNIRVVLTRMNKLLNLRNQVSMDGGEFSKRNAILDQQRDIALAHTELTTLTDEHRKYKEALEHLLSLSVDKCEAHDIIRKALNIGD